MIFADIHDIISLDDPADRPRSGCCWWCPPQLVSSWTPGSPVIQPGDVSEERLDWISSSPGR